MDAKPLFDLGTRRTTAVGPCRWSRVKTRSQPVQARLPIIPTGHNPPQLGTEGTTRIVSFHSNQSNRRNYCAVNRDHSLSRRSPSAQIDE